MAVGMHGLEPVEDLLFPLEQICPPRAMVAPPCSGKKSTMEIYHGDAAIRIYAKSTCSLNVIVT